MCSKCSSPFRRMQPMHTSSRAAGAPGSAHPSGSRVMRYLEGGRWEAVPATEYKAPANHWCGILRTVLIGEGGESTNFDVRYFEIAPGGFSSLESHVHEHA